MGACRIEEFEVRPKKTLELTHVEMCDGRRIEFEPVVLRPGRTYYISVEGNTVKVFEPLAVRQGKFTGKIH